VRELAEAIAALVPVDEREGLSIEAALARVGRGPDPFSESADPHHLTASAFVVSRRGIVLHRHRLLGIWVQPGGHVDPGEDPAAAARRETLEETGLHARHLDPPRLYHVDEHPGPRGHTHYDLRYLLVAPPVAPSPPPGESPDVHWFDFTDALVVAEAGLRPALARLAEEAESLVGGWEDE
jgi:8-oxo-dGTP pyrophosphatase MutT (NUDIX family)